ncbi:MAG: hypothetical protein JW934_02845 [Anaerolineae bacterium]|nr:hypothetical protein [Anaerolineae bacterium]
MSLTAKTDARPPRSRLEWAIITLILLLAAFLRFHDLGNIPRGLEHDEVATWHMVQGVLDGQHALYFEEGYGHEPLYNYLTALPMALFGSNWLGERFWAPWFGLFAVAATFTLMRRLFNPLIALSAAGFQGTVLWALFFNRLGLRLNLLPFLLVIAAYCFWRGVQVTSCEFKVERRELRVASSKLHPFIPYFLTPYSPLFWFALSGLLIGLCFYTYMSSIVVFPLFALFFTYLLARDLWLERTPWQQVLRRRWPALICFAVALLVMAPLLIYRLNRPADAATPQREGQVDMPLRELRRGNIQPVLQNAWALLKMWNVKGEMYWQLNVGSRPVFVEPISGVLFWLGLLIALWRWKEPRIALLLIWVGWGILPSLITSEAPSWPRTMLASPAALALPGIAIAQIGHWLAAKRQTLTPCARLLTPFFLVSLLLASFFSTYRDFLVRWPAHPRVRYAFQSSLTEALRYLDSQKDATPATMAGLSPHDMDPWTKASTLRRRDLAVRWVDTRSALVLPQGNVARLVTLDITPMDPALSAWIVLDRAAVLAQGDLVPRSGREDEPDAPVYVSPAFTVYRLDLPALKQQITPGRSFIGGDAFNPEPLADAPQFGSLLRLEGYQWLTQPQPGMPAQLLTFWTALKTGPRATVYGEPSLKLFVHLLDLDQQVTSSADLLGAAPDTWQSGDLIVQLHTFSYPAESGRYAVELGWYIPPDGPRLPIDGIDAPQQRILLEPIEVRP